jgi:hypothetical protein
MAYAPSKRGCLLIPFNNVPHLFVVLNNPCKNGLCLVVMVSSVKEGRTHDNACLLAGGDHEFIKHSSYVVYRLAEIASAAHITNMVGKKYYTEKNAITEELYARIVAGLKASSEVKPRITQYAKSVGIIAVAKK